MCVFTNICCFSVIINKLPGHPEGCEVFWWKYVSVRLFVFLPENTQPNFSNLWTWWWPLIDWSLSGTDTSGFVDDVTISHRGLYGASRIYVNLRQRNSWNRCIDFHHILLNNKKIHIVGYGPDGGRQSLPLTIFCWTLAAVAVVRVGQGDTVSPTVRWWALRWHTNEIFEECKWASVVKTRFELLRGFNPQLLSSCSVLICLVCSLLVAGRISLTSWNVIAIHYWVKV